MFSWKNKKSSHTFCWKKNLILKYAVVQFSFVLTFDHSLDASDHFEYIHTLPDYIYYTPRIRSMPKGYIVFVGSICLSIRPSIHPSVHLWFRPLTLSLTKFYFEVFWLLITLQPLIKNFSYLVWGYLGGFSSILLLWTPGSCPRAGLEVKI